MARDGKIGGAALNANLVRLAWAFVQVDMPLRGLAVLHMVPPMYLNGEYQAAAGQDPELRAAGDNLANYLVAHGMVDAGAERLEVTPTGQVPGRA